MADLLPRGTELRCPYCGATFTVAVPATYVLCHDRHKATKMEVVVEAGSEEREATG